jgi:transcriptional regulator with XRE-family HTH domain
MGPFSATCHPETNMAIRTVKANSTTIIALRDNRNWTQEALSREAGIGKRSLEKIENGRLVKLETLLKVAAALGVDLETVVAPGQTPAIQMDFFSRKRDHSSGKWKEAVAQEVADLIDLGTSIACSSGTTTALVIAALVHQKKHPQVLTNNIGVIDLAGDLGTISLAGGTYFRAIHATVGDEAERFFEDEAKCRVALLGASACTPDSMIYLLHKEDVNVYDSILKCATERVIIALDVGKLTREDTWRWRRLVDIRDQHKSLQEICVVTNDVAVLDGDRRQVKAAETIQALLKSGIRVVQAKERPDSVMDA